MVGNVVLVLIWHWVTQKIQLSKFNRKLKRYHLGCCVEICRAVFTGGQVGGQRDPSVTGTAKCHFIHHVFTATINHCFGWRLDCNAFIANFTAASAKARLGLAQQVKIAFS